MLKKIVLCIALITSSTITSSEKSYCYYITNAIAAFIIVKVSYNYFHDHYLTPEETIQYCQLTFQAIQKDIHHYHKLYHNDAQMSNWELKEMILDNTTDPYPFLRYYTSLQQTLLLLQKHHRALTTQIAEVKRYAKKLPYKNPVLQLQQEGKNLETQISKIVSLITMLRIRIQLFTEYHEDCYYCKEKIGNA